jgi:CheY-like chemotaxis protein
MNTTLASAAQLNTRNILVVEDDCDDIEIIAGVIREKSSQYSVTCISDVEEAFQYLCGLPEEAHPSLIILDYNLPKLTGIDFLKMVKSDGRFNELPVVMYSTAMLEKYEQEASSLGVDIYISKKNTIQLVQQDVLHMLSYCKSR